MVPFYLIFDSIFRDYVFAFRIYEAKYNFLKNNYLFMWAKSLKEKMNRTKLHLIKWKNDIISDLKIKLMKVKKCLRFLEKLLKFMSNPFYEHIVKKQTKKKKSLKYFKKKILFMQTFKLKIENL